MKERGKTQQNLSNGGSLASEENFDKKFLCQLQDFLYSWKPHQTNDQWNSVKVELF